MKAFLNPIAAAVAALAMVAAPVAAEARGPGGGGNSFHGGGAAFHGGSWNHGGYRGGSWGHGGYGHRGGYWGGPFWGGLGIGLGIGAIGYYGAYGAYDGYYGYPGYPAYVVTDPGYVVDPGYVSVEPPVSSSVRSAGQPVPAASRAPDPIFYPRNGQSAAKAETDRQECNRWATTQSGAMNDASIFQRATFACMEGRGYTVK